MTIKALWETIRRRYDRVILGGMLLALLLGVLVLAFFLYGTAGLKQATELEVARLTPRNPDTTPADLSALVAATERLKQPPQIAVATNAIFAPGMRTACVACSRPIPLEADQCPFCAASQPPDHDPKADSDGDGMPDEWEKRFSLDPRNPIDATQDPDEDCFTNIEEYRAGTDPNDAASAPPISEKLKLLKVVPRPFYLVFQTVNRGADGAMALQINNIVTKQSYFRKLGEDVEGFKLVELVEKKEERLVRGTRMMVDVSELVIQRNGQKIRLTMGRENLQLEFSALLLFTCDGSEHPVKRGGTLRLAGNTYVVIDIDTNPQPVVTLQDVNKRLLMIREAAKRDDQAESVPETAGGL